MRGAGTGWLPGNTLRLAAQLGPAMPAHVVERVHARRSTCDDDAFTEQLPDEETARRVDLLGAPGADPHPREQPVHLAVEVAPIDVEGRCASAHAAA